MYASILYQLREVDFHEMSQKADKDTGDEKQLVPADDDDK
ncbi:hypothetical protein PC129_g21550 [Phytophthora cactorum]|uniref:Uncharacterized protein n=1 Tax=Phytophthora cactorum TaxID=29920 RepID=A0A329RFJ5_9STRA|nr:hypothetical protein Pcac1_g14220 [Phytophthora cactorum]KAG2796243.1 hypothetical protein PC111_g21805 [Phytophthora cactorum]KAG2796570.1 hypothetical protein PC112_g22148 [Phytophthora cactorum]KAG2823590.1 hypothetical protein PC113_g22161 [Phytophthora cactorum]KAG2875289.1 hypothetical protein PC114_g24815 [Phytophthora cactorum]